MHASSVLSNLFLSRSLLISLPNYFWTESGIVDNKFRTLSVASLSLFSFAKNASSSLLISSNSMARFSVCYPSNFENNSPIGFTILFAEIFFFFFLLFISWENIEKCCFLALFTPKMVFRLILVSARCIFYYCICKNNCSKFSKVLILFTKFVSLADGCV